MDIDTKYVVDATLNGIKVTVLEHIDKIAKFTGSDIFLLNSKPADPEGPTASYANGTDQTLDQRLRIAIYGDPESSEHAKMRVLIMIDQIVHNHRSAILGSLLILYLAQTYCRHDEARAFPPHHYMWTNTKEH